MYISKLSAKQNKEALISGDWEKQSDLACLNK